MLALDPAAPAAGDHRRGTDYRLRGQPGERARRAGTAERGRRARARARQRRRDPQAVRRIPGYTPAGLRAAGRRAAGGAQPPLEPQEYTFTVLDSPQVNAFALPGGYVYITRGIMAHLNSEAELAAVLGHEIGHVTARHAVRQYSAAMAADVGFAIGSIFIPEVGQRSAQSLFNVVGSALLSGYGRDHELEADRLGAEYLARTDYDPQAMIKVVALLKNQEVFEKAQAAKEGREPRVYHGVFATHPSADERLQQVVGEAGKYRSVHNGRVERAAYLGLLDGVAFGDSEAQGIRHGNAFYHKGLGVALRFPDGWQIDNTPERLVALSPARDAAAAAGGNAQGQCAQPAGVPGRHHETAGPAQ
ncbi:MAG: M48 family metalloprotease [Chromatiales bacterium]|nr:M48 family metalloprotease [Chromatiales bacterium]